MLTLRGVTVLGDFLRPDGKGGTGGVDRPTAWLFNALRRQIRLASDLPVELFTTTACAELNAWVASLRSPQAADALWASCYEEVCPPVADCVERVVRSHLRARFCVGYELPPYVVRLLESWAIPFVDLRIHPIRFMDDLMFAVRASDPATRCALSAHAVADAEVSMTAGLREAMCRLISDASFPDDTLLVLGQRPYDSSQIVGGAFFDAMDHLPRITDICAQYRGVLLKPHPNERAHSLLVAVAGIAPNILGVVNDNVYRMLAMPQVSAVLTVSSSVAHEAPYFGKTVHALAPLPLRLGWRGDPLDSAMYAALDDCVLSPDFWRMVLRPHTPVTPHDGVRFAAKPNRLRVALDSFWNFNEIDTDRIPSAAVSR
jgi:hypothetical protein